MPKEGFGALMMRRVAPGLRRGRRKTMTFIAGLRVNEIIAPWCLDGAMNGKNFKIYLETQLVPTLKPGDIVIADNLSAHLCHLGTKLQG